MLSLTVIILTFNEELHIARSLQSVRDLAQTVFVIDSGSTDRTVEIAEANGATVLKHPWTNHAQQFNWALDNAPIETDWIMRLDADEIIEPDLAAELRRTVPTLGADVTGINLKRKHIFMDRWVRHGGRYPLILTRVWRTGTARVEDRWMDEHIVLSRGRSITLDGGFADWNLKDLTAFTEKHNNYARREAVEILNQKYSLFARDEGIGRDSHKSQAGWKRYVKERIYNSIPFTVSSTAYFIYRYIVRLGFLDGREGFIYHFLQGYWYRFLVGSKTMAYERAIRSAPTREEKVRILRDLTGLDLR